MPVCLKIIVAWLLSFNLYERSFHVVDFKVTTFLLGIATVLCQADLNFVACQNNRFVWRLLSRDDAKRKGLFVVRSRRVDVPDWQVHCVIGVRHDAFES